jgi:hypothetical protein
MSVAQVDPRQQSDGGTTALSNAPTPPPPYVTWWERVYPKNPMHVVKIAGEDLPHVIPGDTRVPPCTVRLILPPTINSNIAEAADKIRHEIFIQLVTANPELALDAQVTFPKLQGKKEFKRSLIDITVGTPSHFHQLVSLTITLDRDDGKYPLEIAGKGAPVPANLLTVAISHLPA